ncbi:HERC1 [Symbiodinium natans]|uniref:HERC1 protein n=1 Tax=Symbiodinium natans TaxID=878477 RepID=A0A812L5I6_9DINO|nr:HERC1 [Symbiodinium natans]
MDLLAWRRAAFGDSGPGDWTAVAKYFGLAEDRPRGSYRGVIRLWWRDLVLFLVVDATSPLLDAVERVHSRFGGKQTFPRLTAQHFRVHGADPSLPPHRPIPPGADVGPAPLGESCARHCENQGQVCVDADLSARASFLCGCIQFAQAVAQCAAGQAAVAQDEWSPEAAMPCIGIHVLLLSGRKASLGVDPSQTVRCLAEQAQCELGVGIRALCKPGGDVLNGSSTIAEAGLEDGEALTGVVRSATLITSPLSSSMVCVRADGAAVRWGKTSLVKVGGFAESWAAMLPQLGDAKQICLSSAAAAAVLADGRVAAWGSSFQGGVLQGKALNLGSVLHLTCNTGAFAALRTDGTVVAWGMPTAGGDARAVGHMLTEVRDVVACDGAFAALRRDGEVVVWGELAHAAERLRHQLRDVTRVFSGLRAFTALRRDGSAVSFGMDEEGEDCFWALEAQGMDVKHVVSNASAFAALYSDGRVVTWGNSAKGGDSSKVEKKLCEVTDIVATEYAFCALRADGTVVTWGWDSASASDSTAVQPSLIGVYRLASTLTSFAALRKDGRVVTWGSADSGGDSSSVKDQLFDVQEIAGGGLAFAALRSDGTVITWGEPDHGGDSSRVRKQLRAVHECVPK